ncbi:MAG: peptidoglycan DD-metalloendopeptidase family protein [Lachnospiraceae bacterium]|nr:peptidoglycan DD-metalloendopeptidase family protein [Lachnospiraceae bacterium]
MSQQLSPKNRGQALDNGNNKNVSNSSNSAYHQLNTQHNTAQQFRSPVSEQQRSEYSSDSQRQILTNFQQSFNEQRGLYTEQAFNNYEQQQDSVNVIPQSQEKPQYYDYEKIIDVSFDEESFKRYVDDDFERYAERLSTGRVVSDSTSNNPANNMAFSDKRQKIITEAEMPLSGQSKDSAEKGKEKYKRLSVNANKSERLKNDDRTEKGNVDPRLKEDKTEKRISTDNKSGRLKNNESGGRLHEHDESDRSDEKKDKKRDLEFKEPPKRTIFEEGKDFYTDGDRRVQFVRAKGEAELKTLQKQTNKKYNKQVAEQDRKELKNRIKGRLIFSNIKSLYDDEKIEKDETAADVSKALKKGGRATAFILRNNQRDLRNMYSEYGKLKHSIKRQQYHITKMERLDNKEIRQKQRKYVNEATTKEEKRRRKKEMQKVHIEREGNFVRRTQNQFKMAKRSVKYKSSKVKRAMTTVAAVGSILGVCMLSGVIILLVILCAGQGMADYYAEAVVQTGYDTMTDATEYYKNLETDLEEYLSNRSSLESELRSEHGSDIYEFKYNICAFGFSANTIVAYLGAKYNEFELNDIVKEDLKDVFQQMYVLNIYTRMENRRIDDVDEEKKICYVTLRRTELEEVVESRLTEDQLKLYESYKLTTGGQQVYGPVMRENWTNLISSNYGDRIHPITKVRTTHKGVDIAVPTGTKLYSAVKGTVTVAHYSDTAGNMVTIKNDTGWTVTFMHMNSIAVSVNQKVERGDFVGYSGNTGNSTGPHLHLQVNDANGNTVNPIFIIPQTCAVVNDE